MSVDTSNAQGATAAEQTRARVTGAIKQAANTFGTSFQYMLATAKMESDFNPGAGASTSSAHGLYQFIEQTWLGTVKEAGGQLGYGQYADAITKTSSGEYTVSDPDKRKEVMKLRDDPVAASAMAAVLTQSNSFQLTGQIGRRPTDSELYMAHFMGVGGAAKLINAAEDNPRASAARLFPNAAASNRSIFFDRQGSARNVSEVYAVLNSRYAGAASSPATQTALAMYGSAPPATQVASAAGAATAAPSTANAAYLATFPDARAASPGASASNATDASPPSSPSFRSLFQVDERAQPVSSTVRELWGNSAALTSVASTSLTSVASTSLTSVASTDPAAQPQTSSAPQPLDLFSDRSGTFSG